MAQSTKVLTGSDFTLDPFKANENVSQDNGKQIINETLFSGYPLALLEFGGACCIVFAVVGFIGNLISIIALGKCPRLRNATTAFIINLCVADLLFCVLHLPRMAIVYLQREWNYGVIICKLITLFAYSNGTVSVFSILAITINRYVLIILPTKYPFISRPRYVAAIIVTMWILSLFIFALPFFELYGTLGYDASEGTCNIMMKDGKSPKVMLYAIGFGLPCVVFLYCYIHIYCVVRRSNRKIPKSRAHSASEQAAGNRQWFRKLRELSFVFGDRKELKVLCVIMVIFITFVLSYFPVFFMNIFGENIYLERKNPALNVCSYLAVYFTCCINPIIYVAMSREYRQAYVKLFKGSTSNATS